VTLVITDVTEELDAFIIRVVPSLPILLTLMMELLSSSETSVFTRTHGVTSQKTPFFIVTAVKT
jgi:hypothetical protein